MLRIGEFFNFFTTTEFLNFSKNSKELFFEENVLLNHVEYDSAQLSAQIKFNLRWLFSLNDISTVAGCDKGLLYLKLVNFFFYSQRPYSLNLESGQIFFLKKKLSVSLLSNFSPVGVFFKLLGANNDNPKMDFLLKNPFLGFENTLSSNGIDCNRTYYRNPFFLKFNYNLLYDFTYCVNLGYARTDFFNASACLGHMVAPHQFFFKQDFLKKVVVLGSVECFFLQKPIILPTTFVRLFYGRLPYLTYSIRCLPFTFDKKGRARASLFSFLNMRIFLIKFLSLNLYEFLFFALKWIVYFLILRKFLVVYVQSSCTNFLFRGAVFLNLINRISDCAVIFSVPACIVTHRGSKFKNRYKWPYFDFLKFLNLRNRVACGVARFVSSVFISSPFFVKVLLLVEFCKISPPLLNFISMEVVGAKTFNFHLLFDSNAYSYDVLTLVTRLFLSSVSLRSLSGESFLLTKQHFAVGGTTYKRVGQFSEQSLKNFYSSLKFSEYLIGADYFNGLAINNKVLSKFSSVLKDLRGVRIRHGLGFEYYKTLMGAESILCGFQNLLKIDTNPIPSMKKFGKFYTTHVQEPNFLVENSKSFYSLLTAAKNLYSGYSRVTESEIYYSSNLGVLQFTRTGISRKQHLFFYMYSFEERVNNIQFFRKLNIISSSAASVSSNFKLKKFNTMFFDRISENLLFGFSAVSKVNSVLQKNRFLTDTYDVSKFFFFDEFSDSSFFNRFNREINFVDLLKVFSDINPILNNKSLGLSFIRNRPNTVKYSIKLSFWGTFRLNYLRQHSEDIFFFFFDI